MYVSIYLKTNKMKRKASSEQEDVVKRTRVREDPFTFYNKYLWKQISRNGEEESGRILRTIYCQFGKWCAEQKYMVQDTDNLTKLWWFKCIVPFLCHEDPCVKVLNGHTDSVLSVIKLNETTIVSASYDSTLRVWDLTKKFAPEDIEDINSDSDDSRTLPDDSDSDDY